jgi:glycosyltransferase EpsF
MHKKQILHVFGVMNCGGAETMIMNIYRNIDREKLKFSFLVHVTNQGYYDDEIRKLGGKIFYIESQGKKGLLRYILTLKKKLQQNGPFDVVHSHMDWQGGAIALACHLAGVRKIIVHAHTSASYKPTFVLKLVIKLEKYWINKFCTDSWACSKEAGEYLFNKEKNLKVIPNAIDLRRYINPNMQVVENIKLKYNISQGSLVIGHIGSFSPNKNQKFLVEIANKLSGLNKDFRLLLVGSNINDYAKEVKELVDKYKLQQNVYFLGLRDDIHNIVNVFNVFCFPSEFEGLGIVAIEAQAGGVPCIVSSGVSKYIDMGLELVKQLPIDSVDNWVNAIVEKQDSKIYNKKLISEKIIQTGFDIGKSAKLIEDMY